MDKDQFTFLIAGSNKIHNAPATLKRMKLYTPLTLEKEPTNLIDPLAIKVKYGSKTIGYVPNQGRTCVPCNTYVPKDLPMCPKCYGSEIVDRGMAYRIRDSLSSYACLLTQKVVKEDGTVTAWATLILGDTEKNDEPQDSSDEIESP